jgi:hypothetical protein
VGIIECCRIGKRVLIQIRKVEVGSRECFGGRCPRNKKTTFNVEKLEDAGGRLISFRKEKFSKFYFTIGKGACVAGTLNCQKGGGKLPPPLILLDDIIILLCHFKEKEIFKMTE